jgi:hypothetical protein
VLDAHNAGASDDPLAERPAVIARVSGATSERADPSENGATSLDIVETVPAVRVPLLERADRLLSLRQDRAIVTS